MKKLNQNQKNALWLSLFAVATIVLWNIEGGNYVLYPFTILGTWFHEMGHGLTALILGGDFKHLEIYSNGSGLAKFSHNFGRIKLGLTAAAGPFGPTIAGALLIISSTNLKLTKFMLGFLSAALIVSCILWVEPLFGIGFFIIIAFGILLAYISHSGSAEVKRLTLQFLGIQAFVSVYLSIDYLFSSGGFVGNTQYFSDTRVMADNLFLPYWFWGFLILTFSIVMVYYSFKTAFGFGKKPGLRKKRQGKS